MRLLIFGGSGFVGSAVARKAVARNWTVTSLSRSGKPFATPAGHRPAWVDKVDWRSGSAFDPSSYEELMQESDAVVTTLGILFEQEYKDSASGSVSPLRVLGNVLGNWTGDRGNPLRTGSGERQYEKINRDSALSLFRSFASTRSHLPSPASSTPSPRSPFVYISAEDIFRPFVPSRYIQSKREAEAGITRLASESPETTRPIFVRPSLMYHPHLNPPSTLPATLLEATSTLHALLPPSLHLFHSTASPFSSPSSSSPTPLPLPPALASFTSLLSIPPIHVDAVGEAVCRAIEHEGREGVLGVGEMREVLGLGRAEQRGGKEGGAVHM
ncbi:hypothetical protein JCM11641_004046 [Rhodosporidiobolus odoratus]